MKTTPLADVRVKININKLIANHVKDEDLNIKSVLFDHGFVYVKDFHTQCENDPVVNLGNSWFLDIEGVEGDVVLVDAAELLNLQGKFELVQRRLANISGELQQAKEKLNKLENKKPWYKTLFGK